VWRERDREAVWLVRLEGGVDSRLGSVDEREDLQDGLIFEASQTWDPRQGFLRILRVLPAEGSRARSSETVGVRSRERRRERD
jgi:hypothetical protein